MPDPAEAERWSAIALIHGKTSIDGHERKYLAQKRGVLSEHTSFIVATPGRRIDPTPLDQTAGGVGIGHGAGRLGRFHRGRSRQPSRIAWQRFLERAVAARRHACARDHESVHIGIETTMREIVDVSGSGHCLEAAIWDMELPEMFALIGRRTWRIALDPR